MSILYEDSHLMAVDKPQGVVAHPAPGHSHGTLAQALLEYYPPLEGVGAMGRWGMVHRLDKGTSGAMVVAKTPLAYEGLTQIFAAHKILRKYDALALGKNLPVGGALRGPLGRHPRNRLKRSTRALRGQEAITHYRVVRHRGRAYHLECTLETGRTHQIRVHLCELLRCPIVGDSLYGGGPRAQREQLPDGLKDIPLDHPYLHARLLGLSHPITGEELLFEAPRPAHFSTAISSLIV